VEIFDKGGFQLLERREDTIVFKLNGRRLNGTYALVRFKGKESSAKNWLVMRTK